MPKLVRDRLTALEVKRITKPGFYVDGGGLYLRIEGGRRLWVFRFTWREKRCWYAIGSARDVPLADAREQARLCRLMVRAGVNPIDARQADRAARQTEADQTFEAVSRRYIAAHEARWRSSKHAADWINSLTMYALPALGTKPVAAIGIADVLAVLEPIWRAKPETAGRVRGRIEAVLGYAAAMHWREGSNPAAWQGNLKHLLPAKADIAPVQHFAAIAYADLPGAMTALAGADGFAARCLRFLILTAARSSEAQGAESGGGGRFHGPWVPIQFPGLERRADRIPSRNRRTRIEKGENEGGGESGEIRNGSEGGRQRGHRCCSQNRPRRSAPARAPPLRHSRPDC